MSAPPIPDWLRILGWGLLASLVLHWVVLDLMRTVVPLSRGQNTPILQVSLREDASRMEQTTSTPAVPAANAQGVSGDKPVHVGPGLAAMRETAVRSSPTTPMADAAVPLVHIEGLRSGLAAEAMVALRLGLVNRLASNMTLVSSMPPVMLLLCDFDGAGRLQDVRSDVGSVPPAMRDAIKRALAQVAVPESLIGRAFSLDLLLESDQ